MTDKTIVDMEDSQDEIEQTFEELKGQVFHAMKTDENGLNLLHRYRYIYIFSFDFVYFVKKVEHTFYKTLLLKDWCRWKVEIGRKAKRRIFDGTRSTKGFIRSGARGA